jgi:hypothetical protein
MLWDIERTDAEECTIKFKHIMGFPHPHGYIR